MVTVYTDASYKCSMCTFTCLVLTDDTFKGIKTGVRYGVLNSDVAELYGVLDCIKYIKQLGIVNNEITLICDCQSVIERFIKLLSVGELWESLKNQDVWTQLLEESVDLKIHPRFIPSHQREHNPNKVCDFTSNHALRRRMKLDHAVRGCSTRNQYGIC